MPGFELAAEIHSARLIDKKYKEDTREKGKEESDEAEAEASQKERKN